MREIEREGRRWETQFRFGIRWSLAGIVSGSQFHVRSGSLALYVPCEFLFAGIWAWNHNQIMGALSLSLLSFALILILFSDNVLVSPWINWWCPICLEYCCLEKREGLLLPLVSFDSVGVDAHMLPCPKNLYESEHEIRIKMVQVPFFICISFSLNLWCCLYFYPELLVPSLWFCCVRLTWYLLFYLKVALD